MIRLVGLGGAFGAAVRFLFGTWVNSFMKGKVARPAGTWLVNVSGSFLLGLLFSLHQSLIVDDWIWYAIGAGFCGGFTTFSTFSYETVTLLLEGKRRQAAVYVTRIGDCGYFVRCFRYDH